VAALIHLACIGLAVHCVLGALVAAEAPVTMELLEPVGIFEGTADKF
jgi:hypothetical protein